MNKIFSLMLLSGAIVSTAYAENNNEFKVTIFGGLDAQLGYRSQSPNYANNKFTLFNNGKTIYSTANLTRNQKNYRFFNQGYLATKAEYQMPSGFKYGTNIVLQTVAQRDTRFHMILNRSYLFMQKDHFGRIELGGNEGVSRSMAISGEDVAVRGDEFTNEALYYYTSNGRPGPDFRRSGNSFKYIHRYIISSPKTYINRHPIYYNARKVNYYTPVVNGLQLGVSFAPDNANHGDNVSTNNATLNNGSLYHANMKNYLSLGARYETQFNSDSGIAISAAIDSAKSAVNYKRDIFSYDLGTKLHYKQFTLAGSFGNDGKSGRNVAINKWISRFYSVGLGYQPGKLQLSANYFTGKVGDNICNPANMSYGEGLITTSLYSLGASYKVISGLKPYLTLNLYHLKYNKDPYIQNPTMRIGNKGKIVLLGTEITF